MPRNLISEPTETAQSQRKPLIKANGDHDDDSYDDNKLGENKCSRIIGIIYFLIVLGLTISTGFSVYLLWN